MGVVSRGEDGEQMLSSFFFLLHNRGLPGRLNDPVTHKQQHKGWVRTWLGLRPYPQSSYFLLDISKPSVSWAFNFSTWAAMLLLLVTLFSPLGSETAYSRWDSSPIAPQMGLEPTIFGLGKGFESQISQLKLHTSSQDLMKLRFFESWPGRNLVRGKLIDK